MTRLTSRLAWTLALAFLAGCVGNRSIGTGQPCPCAPGWSCDTATNTCVVSTKACDDYFAATYLRCGGPRFPPEETTRIQARFEQVCANQIALPGSGVTSATLEACASALNESACEFPAGPPQACNFKGALSGGAACTDPLQCQSGFCQGQVSITPGGESKSRACGVCEAAAHSGENCNGAGCTTGACMTQDTTASMPTYTCRPIVQGVVNAPCDELTAICEPGTYCAAHTGTCTPLGTMGAPCGDGPTLPGAPGGCIAPLACVGPAGFATCSSGALGASCAYDLDCSPGLGCSASGQCVSITWANPGEVCGDAVRCLVGICGLADGSGLPTPAMDGGGIVGICPMVVPDGQPCLSGTCDTFSACFDGKCELLDSVVCR